MTQGDRSFILVAHRPRLQVVSFLFNPPFFLSLTSSKGALVAQVIDTAYESKRHLQTHPVTLALLAPHTTLLTPTSCPLLALFKVKQQMHRCEREVDLL
jgi:hypothetical protein